MKTLKLFQKKTPARPTPTFDFESMTTSAMSIAWGTLQIGPHVFVPKYWDRLSSYIDCFVPEDLAKNLELHNPGERIESMGVKYGKFDRDGIQSKVRSHSISAASNPRMFRLLGSAQRIDATYAALVKLDVPELWSDLLLSRPNELRLISETGTMIRRCEKRREVVEAGKALSREGRKQPEYLAAVEGYQADEKSINVGLNASEAVVRALEASLEAVNETLLSNKVRTAALEVSAAGEAEDAAVGVEALAYMVQENALGTESTAKETIKKQQEIRGLGA